MKDEDLTPQQRQRLDQSADPITAMKTSSAMLDLLHEERQKQRDRLDALEGEIKQVAEEAFKDGYRCGMIGTTDQPPSLYRFGTIGYTRWLDGYADGKKKKQTTP